jgi:predicted DNA-binding transcriptional regulator AlpA
MREAMPVEPMQLTSPAIPSRRPLVEPHVRLGLRRAEAAEYVGVGVSMFDQMVADGRMPKPKLINARRVWQRQRLDQAFAELPEEGQDNDTSSPWTDFAYNKPPASLCAGNCTLNKLRTCKITIAVSREVRNTVFD